MNVLGVRPRFKLFRAFRMLRRLFTFACLIAEFRIGQLNAGRQGKKLVTYPHESALSHSTTAVSWPH